MNFTFKTVVSEDTVEQKASSQRNLTKRNKTQAIIDCVYL